MNTIRPKTTAMAVPQVLDAPGVVYCTSNKRDLLDLTKKPRGERGHVWVFDPQGIAGTETPEFWWDPLDACRDIMGARMTADVFASASRPPNATRDSYFDPAGEELLATYLLAAAAGAEAVTAVYRWVTNDRDDTPVGHLKDAGHLDLSAAAESTMHLPDRQRAGVFGTAAKIVAWMADPRLRAWVVSPSDGRPRLDVAALLEEGSGASLYSLSKEGVGSAGALTGALTTTFLTEAERRGQVSPSGRLAVPVVAVLDEVANVCRWRDLPPATAITEQPGHCLVLVTCRAGPREGGVLGPRGHEEAVGGGQHTGLWRRNPRGRVLGGRQPHPW